MADRDKSETSKLLQSDPPPYQEHFQHPNAGYPPAGSYPSTSGFQGQQYGAPAGPYNQGAYPGNSAVTVQPVVYLTTVPLTNPPPDYLVYSVFTLLCCCLPLGLAALVYSIYTREAVISGNRQLAESMSRTARMLNSIALGIGLTCLIVYIICVFVFTVNAH
ncbi:synapse differentiation-inducing gene protein 1-like [Triplophysa dalaica]|uniref:synapse differentiation-inducing gene protein 1-like n=1 Tax=Triplophysa dalaica TaxID=1582913 RepID=UPI0024E00B05|nr:synapse differentiation-inducing gene protein 1-like [Triplophysa dalaica]